MADFTYKMIEGGNFAVMTYEGQDEEVTVPDLGGMVLVIGDDVFKGHKELKKVVIPESVIAIGGFVFDGCESLKEVVLPSQLQQLWQYAFVRSSIERIELPKGVREIIPFTFKDCKALKEVVCHEGTLKICAYAFQGCQNLQRLILPKSLELDERALLDCPEVLIIRREV